MKVVEQTPEYGISFELTKPIRSGFIDTMVMVMVMVMNCQLRL